MKDNSLLNVILCLFFSNFLAKLVQSAKPPNVVVILSDDLGWGSLDQNDANLTNMIPGVAPNPERIMYTPNIDRITKLGKQFKKAYAASCICGPSRSSILSGMRTDQTFIRDNIDPAIIDISFPTIPTVFNNAGYYTVKWGKHGLGGLGEQSSPHASGYQQFSGYYTATDAHLVYPVSLAWYNDSKRAFPNNRAASISMCAKNSSPCTYATDVFLAEFKKFISEQNSNSRPFYAELALTQPHVGRFAKSKTKYGALIPTYGMYNSKPWSQNRKGLAAMVTYLDSVVGDAYDSIQEAGIGNNTLFIITSDNGAEFDISGSKRLPPLFFEQNGGLRLYKRFITEGGTRVPFVAIWPGMIKANTLSNFPINQYDLLRTFEHILSMYNKTSVPATRFTQTIDGPVSILPVLLGQDTNSTQITRKYMSTEFCPGNIENNCKWAFYKTVGWSNSYMKLMYDVSDDRFPYNKFNGFTLQLYNLTADEGEKNNLINDPQYSPLIDELMQQRDASRIPLPQ